MRDLLGCEEKQEEDEVEVELVAERPALQDQHVLVGRDEQVGGEDVGVMVLESALTHAGW